MDDELTIDCELHGERRRITFVCTHIAHGLLDGTSPGFVTVPEPGEALPLAWCDACETFVITHGDGTWTDDLRGEADFKLLCEDCYAEAKGLAITANRFRSLRPWRVTSQPM